ncbi:cytochrome P460 family protein [Dongia soli]|uniref:cytochrome P460 family protein n=1 Tax=Dongia soli TaxID=600628 RepID=UPI00361EBC18
MNHTWQLFFVARRDNRRPLLQISSSNAERVLRRSGIKGDARGLRIARTIAAYRKHGHFPDGAVLVKEVFKTTTKDMTTGTVRSAGTLAGWFIMVKESVGDFPEQAFE